MANSSHFDSQSDLFDLVLEEVLTFRQQLTVSLPRGDYLLAQNVFLLVASADSRGGVTVKELTNSFGASPNSPRYHLEYFIKNKLFFTVSDPRDSRVKRVLLSESGKRVKEMIRGDLISFLASGPVQEFVKE